MVDIVAENSGHGQKKLNFSARERADEGKDLPGFGNLAGL